MTKRAFSYNLFQTAGWGLLLIMLYLSSLLISSRGYLGRASVTVGVGLVASHLLRNVIVRYGWMGLRLKKVMPGLLFGIILISVIAGLLREAAFFLLGDQGSSLYRLVGGALIEYPMLLVPWTVIYYLYHYMEMNHKEFSRNRQLELRLEEMKKQSEAEGTSMDAIMQSLQRIGSLIEEDPGRSREEITAFSNLLRKGYI